jgi:hypothetical protein
MRSFWPAENLIICLVDQDMVATKIVRFSGIRACSRFARSTTLSLFREFHQRAILLAYAAYVLTPLVHGLTLAEHAHPGDCRVASESGPSLWVPCESPCNDPAHHHHHAGHDSDHCTICQAHSTNHALVVLPYASEGPAEAGDHPSVTYVVPTDRDHPGPQLTRGPPVTR